MEAAELINNKVIPMLVCMTITNVCTLLLVLIMSNSNKKDG